MRTEAIGPPSRIIVVEDDAGMRRLLDDELNEQGHEVTSVANVADGTAAIRELRSNVVVADMRLPDGCALDLLEELRRLSDPPAFVVITAFGSISQAVDALKAGADDFLTKPLDLDYLRLRLERILDVQRLKGLVREQCSAVRETSFHGMVGRSVPMRHLFSQIRQLAGASGPVLILGESGVGKEMVARAIHEESDRASGPFVAINCAALPEGLVESELFGHAAGAFTGAGQTRQGLFESAAGGTVLLDELTELPAPVQAKLLRTLQEGTLRKVGANREQEVDVRIIAATNGDVERQMDNGELRRDLYFRLETFVLEVPPLRERPDDIEALTALFLSRFRIALDKPIDGFTSEALSALRSYDYPGNVRELENIVERGVTFCRKGEIRLEHLGPKVADQYGRFRQTEKAIHALIPAGELPPLEALKRDYVRYALNKFDGNKRRTASALGIGRRTLYRYLEPEKT
ncbi:MAG: sigma-54 dependent transcriptional regulator [Polyangia bacterium]